MATLQIRLGKGSPLWDIAQEVIFRIDETFLKHPEIVPPRAGQMYTLTHIVLRRLRQAVEAYAVCGTRTRCHVRSTPAGVGGPWDQPPPGNQQRILLLKEGVDALCTRLAADVFDHLCPNASTRQWLSLIPEIDQTIQDTLGPLLYENPFCDNCPRCTPGCRTDPWTTQEKRSRRVRKGA